MAPHPCVYGQHFLDIVGYQGTKDMRLEGGYVGRDMGELREGGGGYMWSYLIVYMKIWRKGSKVVPFSQMKSGDKGTDPGTRA